MAFALNFGEREEARGGTVVKQADYRLTTGLNDVSNLGKDGKVLPRDSRAALFNLGNWLWHSDSSFRPIPAKFS
ncbi:TauD/TfdA family dioxygenase, partial [Acinetobacter baumannii]